ncbi:D-aminoacyl-tRNA deacylase [Halobacterium litoreum]|uniref:D-aminoacyl-tRNA deacylase n=1 Tax=Halobacterium litoreum TaxID=2039234 RepID=A0ABD5NGN2_9EURY|nr:D-aminoacyl-tRNA deacylase [Halobacterium litoreum]UHH12666.1 D-tyrosyl-tRNA(Tyr) deacylase [Halobacterium litoreum]
MIGIVVSRADEASVHIGDHVRDLGEFERVGEDAYRADGFALREFDDLHLHLDDVAAAFDDPEFVVFVSRHSGDTGPLLSAHFTGNFGAAKYGGSDRAVAPACPNAHREVMGSLREHAPDGYDVAMECTHHGPTSVGAPSMFVELGSDEAEWEDPEGARAVARAVLDLEGVSATGDRSLVAFGGGHYAPRPTRILEDTDWGFGHVAADWCLSDLGDPREHRDQVAAVFEASDATRAVVDGDKPALEAEIENLGHRVVSETWVRETDGVPLSLADDLEADVATVDDGLRFGDVAEAYDSGYLVVDLPPELLDAAHAVDPDATVEAGLQTALAVATDENGNRLAGPAAFPDKDAYEDFVDRLAALLAADYDAVTRENGDLEAVREAFDPAAASERGVPEGPKFGRLANGESVAVNGEKVDPTDVSRTERITVSVDRRERTRERVRRPSDAEGKGN